MALSEDQRALLSLLVGGQTYEGVAEVLGISPAEVKIKAREAADALEREPDGDFSPEAVRSRLEGLDRPGSAAPPNPAAAEVPRDRRGWALWLALAAAVALAIVVVAVTRGGGSGGGDESPQPTGGGQEEAVPVKLTPVNGSRASGTVTITRVVDQPAVDIAIRGLA
ncbi:MAG: hypothetical protein ACJ75Z_08625, partial [Solirubrobacterales bacterium]